MSAVLENAALDGARILAHPDAIPQHEARGWVVVGPCSDPLRDPIRTDDEQAAFDASEAARLGALLDPKSSAGAAAAASKPARAAASPKE